ncbi:hypothetical protein TCAL_03184 [Tigriopus californicus]|uniref:Major facilitator superfamily (MFS) profile domain-containing protein n=1 Tax=Tigriopus californicus TaxID=6832 RepID=A0A553N9W7_TIGCA|nr:organic cation transporter protein-like [Tigriopus californicus]TRY62217.1 hypothetical protein TCAL_03184 [Tigriopus californicus]|eukprot:TCALIF_03184-PA protein Name:"Similar to Orct Organic cation transporter protein (Drosophila melanogaster)" AED:0.06 eAED:0.06 QI:236/0.85/0.62/1/0.85/0.75/8/0/536
MSEDKIDQVHAAVGQFGKWQAMLISVVATAVSTPTAWHILAQGFLSKTPDFTCDIQNQSGAFSSIEEWNKFSSPLGVNEDGRQSTEREICQIYNFNYDQLDSEQVQTLDLAKEPYLNLTGCPSFWYNTTVRTIVTDFDLVCERKYLVTLAQSVFMIGLTCGCVVAGHVSDKIGRLKAISLFGALLFISDLANVFSINIYMYLCMRFCMGFTLIAASSAFNTYCIELLGGKWVTIIGVGKGVFWTIGYITTPLLAYYIQDWIYLQSVISVGALSMAVVFFFVPESPKWFLAVGKLDQAERALRQGANINGLVWKEDTVLFRTSKDDEKASIFTGFYHLLATPNMRKKALIQFYLWFTCSLVYYALTLNVGTLFPGNTYINFFISGLIELPVLPLVIVILLYLGRRGLLSLGLLFSAIFMGVTLVVPAGTASIVTGLLGKFCITGCFFTLHMFANEMFPTVVRNTGYGASNMCARFASILAPIFGRELGRDIPLVVFGVLSLIGSVLVLFLPETKNKKLPDSLEEGEEFGKVQKFFSI